MMLDRGIGRVIDHCGVSFLFDGIRDELKSADASIIMSFCIGETNMTPIHNQSQECIAKALAEAGADVVVGHTTLYRYIKKVSAI